MLKVIAFFPNATDKHGHPLWAILFGTGTVFLYYKVKRGINRINKCASRKRWTKEKAYKVWEWHCKYPLKCPKNVLIGKYIYMDFFPILLYFFKLYFEKVAKVALWQLISSDTQLEFKLVNKMLSLKVLSSLVMRFWY